MTKAMFQANQVIPKTPVRDRILGSIKVTEQGCWEWQLSKHYRGYGLIKIDHKTTLAHRVSYETFVGSIPKGAMVIHNCDNPPCVNPEHLRCGTHRDNIDDMVAKGRSLSGEQHNLAKLSWNEVREIRALYQTGGYTLLQLAEKYSVSKPTIWGIVQYRYWKE